MPTERENIRVSAASLCPRPESSAHALFGISYLISPALWLTLQKIADSEVRLLLISIASYARC